MENYKHILLAVDFFELNNLLIDKAKNIAEKYQASLSLVHIIDNLPLIEPYSDMPIPMELDITTVLVENARSKLLQLAKTLAIPEQNVYLEVGSTTSEIINVAKQCNADLIIVGSHGRHGFALLLGSTANGVLHHATCDVLAVRLLDD